MDRLGGLEPYVNGSKPEGEHHQVLRAYLRDHQFQSHR